MSDDNVQSWEVDFVVGYANHGKQLPKTKEEYCARLHISGDAATRISDYIGPLMAVYAPEQEECQIFHDESYPAASEAASSAFAIAQSAVHGHEYGDIVQAIKDIDNASSEEVERLQKIIRDGIDAEVETLAHDLDQAQKVLDGLNPLQERTPGDFDALEPCRVTLTSFHAAEQITLDDLNLNLAQLQFQASLFSPGSAVWLALQTRIEECEAIVSVQQAVVVALVTILDDLRTTALYLEPATGIIGRMTTEWSTIYDALRVLHEMVDSDLRNANAVLVDRVVADLITKWKELKVQVQAYCPG